MLNTDKRPVDGSIEVPVSDAGKILKNSGYKISNNELDLSIYKSHIYYGILTSCIICVFAYYTSSSTH